MPLPPRCRVPSSGPRDRTCGSTTLAHLRSHRTCRTHPGGGSGGAAQEPPPTIDWESTKAEKVKEDKPERVATGQGSESSSTADAEEPEKKKGLLFARKKKDKPTVELDVLERARESGKPILLFLVTGDANSAMGKASLTMNNFVFRNQKVFDAAQKLHPVKIDVKDVPKEILKRYKVRTAPTVVFLDFQGKVLTRIARKSKPAKMLAVMNAVIKHNEKLKAKSSGS